MMSNYQAIKGFVKSNNYDWGNFLSYSNKAAKTMTKNKKQTKMSWNKLVKEISKIITNYTNNSS